MSQYPTDITVGGTPKTIVAPAPPPPPAAVAVNLPVAPVQTPQPFSTPFSEPIQPVATQTIFPVIGDCGTSALIHASAAATPDSQKPPVVPQAFTYRQKGNYDSDGLRGAFPATESVTISNITATNPTPQQYGPTFTYDVTEVAATGTTTTTFQVLPENAASNPLFTLKSNGVAVDDPAGVYIKQITSTDPTSLAGGTPTSPLTVRWSPGIKVLPFQAQENIKWTTSGSDAGTGSSFSFTGVITQEQFVDACGHVLEGWEAHLSGNMSSATRRTASVDWVYTVGTQYGGFLLTSHIVEAGSDSGVRAFADHTSEINGDPKVPQ